MKLTLTLLILSTFAEASDFRIGTGLADITGPLVNRQMLGYARGTQNASGLLTRLRARSFVIESMDHTKRVALVNTDLHSTSIAVKEGVIKRLNEIYPDLYSQKNVMISAIHNHSGTGGYTEDRLLNLSTLGRDQRNYNVIVDGIVQSIKNAHQNLTPGQIFLQKGELSGASMNRSKAAYLKNAESKEYPSDVDQQMTLLKFVSDQGEELGLINWFAVHNTSMSDKNIYINGDNKGLASYYFEKLKGTDYSSPKTFVAAFANSNEGDVSPFPNIYAGAESTSMNEIERTSQTARLQQDKAKELYDIASEPLGPELNYQHTWITMPGYQVQEEFTGNQKHTLCKGALGLSFAAGAPDGLSNLPGLKPGLKQGDPFEPSFLIGALHKIFQVSIFRVESEDEHCHYPKPIFLATGRHSPAWVTETLPFQLIRIGSLAIVAVPSEMTTMAGRKLRKTVHQALSQNGVHDVILAGLSNHYSLYVTTEAEYNEQFYEGAATLFGPHTLAAYQQIFASLAQNLSQGIPTQSTPQPPTLGKLKLTRAFDYKPDPFPRCNILKDTAGKILSAPDKSYQRGQTVTLSFQSGKPNDDLVTKQSLIEVQRKTSQKWESFALDWEPETRILWKKDVSLIIPPLSQTVISWTIPETAPLGTYRVIHRGVLKVFSNRCSYEAVSPEFEVR